MQTEDVDIDPNWYPGQIEVMGLATESDPVPTVLTKLQKWGDYHSVGDTVLPTKFIPMKTPLGSSILEQWGLPERPKHSLTVSSLLAQQESAGRTVGLIIDLSNHDCLYQEDIPAHVEYSHIKLVAKELPPLDFVAKVAEKARSFWQVNPHAYIAIHCAYGYNRTGFVVCSYLIQELGLTVDEALGAFGAARPPGIKHEKFIAELHRRYSLQSVSHWSSLTEVAPILVPKHVASTCSDDNSSIGGSPGCSPDIGMERLQVKSALAPRLPRELSDPDISGTDTASTTNTCNASPANANLMSSAKFGFERSVSVSDNPSLGPIDREMLLALRHGTVAKASKVTEQLPRITGIVWTEDGEVVHEELDNNRTVVPQSI